MMLCGVIGSPDASLGGEQGPGYACAEDSTSQHGPGHCMRAEHSNAHIHQLEVEIPAMLERCETKGWEVHEAAGSLACSMPL